MKERIRELRKTLKLTQEKFAKKIGAADSTIGNWEKGRQIPPKNAVTSICREFNVSETWLRTGEGEMFETSPAPTDAEKRQTQKEFVVAVFQRLTSEQQDVIIESLNEYLNKQKESASLKTQTNNGTVNGDMIQN